MTDRHEIDIAYVAPVTFVRERARKEQTQHVTGTTRVAIPDVPAAEAPLVLRARLDARTDPRGMRILQRRLLDGRLYEPYRPAWTPVDLSPNGLSAEEVFRLLGRVDQCALVLFPRDCPWRNVDMRKAGPLPLDVARIVSDERDRIESLVREAATKLVVIDGILHREEPAPRLMLFHYPSEGEWHPGVCMNSGHYGMGYAFRLGRDEAFAGFLETAAGLGLKLKGELDIQVDRIQPEARYFEEDRHNAVFALHHAMLTAGAVLPYLPPEAIHVLAMMAQTKKELAERTAAPAHAEVLLRHLAEATPAAQEGVHRALRLGREALAISLPSVDLEAEDVAAFDGLSM